MLHANGHGSMEFMKSIRLNHMSFPMSCGEAGQSSLSVY